MTTATTTTRPACECCDEHRPTNVYESNHFGRPFVSTLCVDCAPPHARRVERPGLGDLRNLVSL